MKIALHSIRPEIAKKENNIKKIEQKIEQNPAEFHIFGELSLTGYKLKDELRSMAENINGPSIKKIRKIAKEKQTNIIFGMPLKDPKIKGIIHNSAIFIQPDGNINTYDKWFLPTFGPFEEKIFLNEGDKLPVFNTKHGKIGLLICYDLFFPEICKAYSLQGADILICISASPSITRKYFETLLPTRAIENTTFIIYANIVGPQDDLVFWGGSQIYSPLGEQLAKTPYFKESTINTNINLDDIEKARANRPVIRDIRPEIYQDLYNYSHRQEKEQK